MMNKTLYLIFLFTGVVTVSPISAQKNIKLQCSVVAQLPDNEKLGKQPGLAGAIAGYLNNKLIIAGGANFPDSMPWQGGKKVYWNDIYVLNISKKGKYSWENSGTIKLKESIAYGASVNTRSGIVCIGGENEKGISKKVFLIHTDNPENKIDFIDLPELPVALTNLSAIAVNEMIYVAGGETVNGVSKKLFRLNINKIEHGWIELQPLPVEVSHAVMLRNYDGLKSNLYLIGGRKKNANNISDFYSSVFEYNIEKNEWTRKKDMPYAVSAGFGISTSHNKLFYIGGDKGGTFHEVEKLLVAIASEKDELKKQQLVQQKNKLQINHPGFNKEILEYDVVKDEWTTRGKVSVDMPVTTTIVAGNHKFYIPSGEIKAGVRTSQILVIK
jgi:N-acetylneuraminate epimerase